MKKRKVTLRKKIKRRDHFFVYILRCKNGTYYTGYTHDLKKRLALHNSGKGAKYLRGKLPVELAYYKNYVNYKCALNEERRIKTLPRKTKDLMIKECPKSFIRKVFKPSGLLPKRGAQL